MNYETKHEIAKFIVHMLGSNELTQEQWDEIKEAHKHFISPRVIVRSKGSEFRYVAGSPNLKAAVNILVNSVEEFEVVMERKA